MEKTTLYFVPGVKFRTVGTHVNMEVQATPFNFTTGLLEQPAAKSIWINNDNTDVTPVSPRYFKSYFVIIVKQFFTF